MTKILENENPASIKEAKTTNIEMEWFDQLIHHINSDKFLIGEKLASKETTDFWKTMIHGDISEIMNINRVGATKYFISKLIMDYMNKIHDLPVKPNKLLIDYNDSELLIWGEVNEDDEDTETNLFRVEGQINAEYHKYGFQISSTIVESSDSFIIPPHYKELHSYNTPA